MSDSVRPHRWQPTRLPRPWDSPGKNTGVGCHFLLQCMKVKSESEVAQSCPTLSNCMDYSLPGSPVHGSFQARVLEWVALAFSSGSSLVGLMVTSFKRLMPHPGLLHPEPCPCGSPLLTRTSTGDAQTQFCLSICGVPGSWCAQGLFEPSEHLWWEWCMILDVNRPSYHLAGTSPLSLDMGHVSPHRRPSTVQPIDFRCWFKSNWSVRL